MIDIELIRTNPELVKKNVASRNYDSSVVDEFLKLDGEWRTLTAKSEALRAEQKKLGAERKIEEAKKVKTEIEALAGELETLDKSRLAAARKLPNISRDWVPAGKTDADNKVALRIPEAIPTKDFPVKDYFEVAQKLGIIDTERAGKVSGSRFGYLLGGAARLEFAITQFAMDTVTNVDTLREIAKSAGIDLKELGEHPFIPVIPPVMIKHSMMEGMGYVERGGDEIYNLKEDGLYLVGTSEQSVGTMHADETLPLEQLPRRYIAFSTCFRREAGSYGKDTKGVLRVHQFDKSEMFSLTTPEKSDLEHRFFRAIEEYFMQKLELPYQVLDICSADLGDPAAAKWDIEVWFPAEDGGKGKYRETHSTSNTTDFQSRRLGIKYKPLAVSGKPSASQYVHMVNGTAFSQRPILAIIENNQTKEGTIKVPSVLQKYMSGLTEIK
jgi:seryl-tRNA synthetase